MPKNTRTFSDIDLNFTAHPVTGDLVKRYDDAAIKQSVKNLVLTQNYERPFHSEIGSTLRGLLFEPASPITARLIEKAIQQTILNFEPRVVLDGVVAQFSPDNNSVYVTVYNRQHNNPTDNQLNP